MFKKVNILIMKIMVSVYNIWDMLFKGILDMISVSINLYCLLTMRDLSSNCLVTDVFLLERTSHTAKWCSYQGLWAVITTNFCRYLVFIVSMTKVLIIWISFALTNGSFELLCGNQRFYVMNSIKFTACFRSDDAPWYIIIIKVLLIHQLRHQ